jgi:hypothetical protein
VGIGRWPRCFARSVPYLPGLPGPAVREGWLGTLWSRRDPRERSAERRASVQGQRNGERASLRSVHRERKAQIWRVTLPNGAKIFQNCVDTSLVECVTLTASDAAIDVTASRKAENDGTRQVC